jgi:hypothetical protein
MRKHFHVEAVHFPLPRKISSHCHHGDVIFSVKGNGKQRGTKKSGPCDANSRDDDSRGARGDRGRGK